MKKWHIGIIILTVLSVIFSVISCTNNKQVGYKLAPYKELTLDNGLSVLLIPNKKLPIFSIHIVIGSGSASDPENKLGLSNLSAQMLMKGTAKKTAKQIAEDLEFYGNELGVSTNKDTTRIDGSALSYNKEHLIEDVYELMTSANFPADELKKLQTQTVSVLQSMVDNPSSFADQLHDIHILKGHPYSHSAYGKISHIKKIDRKDILKFSQQHYVAKNMGLAITGDFDDKTVEMIKEKFGQIPSGSKNVIEFPELKNQNKITVHLVNKSDLKQTVVSMGHLAPRRTEKDYMERRVLVNVLGGGGFSTRLMKEIRVKRGLTYGIYAYFDVQKDYGSFVVSSSVNNEKVYDLTKETLNVIKDMVKTGATEEEVELTQATYLGSFPRALETPERLAQTLLSLRFYGVSDEYLQNYTKNIRSITAGQINPLYAKYIFPEKLHIIVFAPKQVALPQLEKLKAELGNSMDIEISEYTDYLD